MAYGDKDNGTLFLYEVPSNLKSIQENEEENIQKFWDREIENRPHEEIRDKINAFTDKCLVKFRKVHPA